MYKIYKSTLAYRFVYKSSDKGNRHVVMAMDGNDRNSRQEVKTDLSVTSHSKQ